MEHEDSGHYEHHEHQEPHHKKKNMTEKIRTNPWIISTFVLGILAIILIVGSVSGGITGKTISQDKVGEYLISYFEAQGATGLSLNSIDKERNFYKVNLDYEGQLIPFYVTKDGYLTGNSLLLITPQKSSSVDTPITIDVPKTDVPKVELFIMTHCPYGTQAEKGIIPVIKALGDTADIKIRFVHYFMHDPEETETPIQVCIREEQSDKWVDYLECFLEDGDSDRCLLKVGIDKSKLDTCVQNSAENYYALDSELSQDYGVQGSPTFIVNGKIISSARDPASYLDTICQAFNDVPEECGLELSSASPSPGFGWDETGASTSAQC